MTAKDAGVALTDDDRARWLRQLHQFISDHNKRGGNGVLACSALKHAYRQILCADTDVAVVYLKAQRDLIRSRLPSRKGHYMPQSLIESQFRGLEEPAEGVIVDAAGSPEQTVAAVRSQLGK